MKHTGHIDINKPIDQVTAIFANPEYLKEYQYGFVGKKLISGTPQQAGAKSMMYYEHGGRKMELEETIVTNNLPDNFEAFYHHKHMDNTMVARFEALDQQTTRYHYAYHYTRINWIMPKLMAILSPSMYTKLAEKWLQQFKEFVEKQ